MISHPGLDQAVGDRLGGLGGHGEDADDDLLLGDDRLELGEVADPHAADLLADDGGLDVEHGDDLEAVVGEDVGAGDRLAELAGAEEGDVVLARGAQDLADLGDQRLDVVADAALAELAEAGEVAADLGRVDVRVLGEFLRGDRVAAHLAGLGEHLQVAREASRDAERQPLAVDDQALPRSAPRPSPRSSAPRTVSSRARSAVASRLSSETTTPSTSTTGIFSSIRRSSSSSLSMSTSCSSNRGPRRGWRRSPRAPRRRDGSRAASRR